MVSPPGQNMQMGPSVAWTGKKSASSGMSGITPPAIMEESVRTSAPSVVPSIMPSPGNADQSPLTSEDFLRLFLDTQSVLTYTDFSFSIVRREFNSASHSNSNIFNKIISPYSAEAFNHFLHKHNIAHLYPFLVSNLLSGFPIGFMPMMTITTIIPNHSSCAPFMTNVLHYLAEEVQDGRMSGPLSCADMELMLHGPFYKLRMCKHLSKGTKDIPSVNSHVLKGTFPTRFDTASHVADIVSPSTFLYSYTLYYSILTIYNSQFTIHNSQSTILNSQFSILNSPNALLHQIVLAPSGTQACTFDIAKFHRTCPVLPDHKPWLVVQGRPHCCGQLILQGCKTRNQNDNRVLQVNLH